MKQKLLLLQDVDDLGKSGDVVLTKPGYARNFLIPQRKAVFAYKHTLRMQERLKEERAKKAEIDRKGSEEVAAKVKGVTLEIEVKVDPEGKLYGSVSTIDVVRLFEEKGIKVERRNIQLTKPLKETGTFPLTLKLKEGIVTSFHLRIIPEGTVIEELIEEAPEKEKVEEKEEVKEEETSS